MSDEEFDLKKKKKKSKKVDFDAFETEDAPNDGGDDAGVAAAVAEKIEDLDRTCFSLVFLSFWVFLCLLFSSSASSFVVHATAVFIRRKEMVTTMRTRRLSVVEPSRFWT